MDKPISCSAGLRRLLICWTFAVASAAAGAHPLVDTVWDADARQAISAEQLVERAARGHVVLLGETHDHPEHHRIQLLVFDGMLAQGRRPALVMEQYDVDQQGRIDAILSDQEADAQQKRERLRKLMRDGWEWKGYAHLIERALDYDLPIVAANLPRAELRKRAAAGDATDVLDAVWNEQREAELAHRIDAGHCGKLPPHLVGTIVRAQRLRDAAMAEAIGKQRAHGAVAVLGSGHVRRDLGVPLYLGSTSLLAIGLIETDRSEDAHSYAVGSLGTRYDYVWFTAPVRRASNPCDSIPAQHGKQEERR